MAAKDLPLLELFTQLREVGGLPLGIGEYQQVLKAWRAGYGTADRNALKRLCRTIWVKSPEEEEIFESQFNRLIQQLPERKAFREQDPIRQFDWFNPKYAALAVLGSSTVIIVACLLALRKDTFNSGLSRLPLQVTTQSASLYESAIPLFPSNQTEEIPEVEDNLAAQQQEVTPVMVVQPEPVRWWKQYGLSVWIALWLLSGATWWWLTWRAASAKKQQAQALEASPLALNRQIQDEIQLARLTQTASATEYLPVTRRQMKQSWRYLRRMVREGPPTELDVDATVQDIGRRGLLLTPVFRARRVNRAEVLLLVDQDGSMVPFHSLSQRLVETALQGGRLTRASVYYFHNCPVGALFHDPFFQSADAIDQVLQAVSSDYAGVLIVSDGGAACGSWNPHRLQLTEQFLQHTYQRVRYLAWLNPMPQDRWANTTAGAIASQVPMFEFNRTGFDAAISVLRGQRGNSP
jgi:uncharacterized protein with von Willebrand factor type A (vWA) domain